MYESFYGFRERPFSLLPDPSFLYMTDKHRRALTMLEYGLTNQVGFTVITGEIGSGKTTLIRKFLQKDDPNITVGLINNTQCSSADELLRWVAFAFGLNYEGRYHVQLYDVFTEFLINQYSQNRRVFLVIDEAQELGIGLLEQVRMLSNINADKHQVVQFILVGQPTLRDHLRRPEVHQLAQRISVDYHLEALNREETRGYIRHRIEHAGGAPDLFSDDACRLIWRHSRGVPRLINTLCDTSLVYGFSDQIERIDQGLVRDVLKDKAASLAPVQEQIRERAVEERAPQDHDPTASPTERNITTIEKLFRS